MKLCFWNNELICATETPYDVGLPGHQWLDAPNDHDPQKRYKLSDGAITEVPLVEYAPKRLRIYRVAPLWMDHEYIKNLADFSIMGFRKIAPNSDRGRKVKAEYKCVDKDEVIVDKIFTDLRETGTGRLTDLQMLIQWYCEDGTVGASKTEIVKSYTKTEAETEERKRRERAVDFLRSEGKDTPIEPVMDALFYHYHEVQLLYKENGSISFRDAMLAETDATINAYLAIRVPTSQDPNYTIPIKEAILYQIHAIDDAAFMAALQPVSV